MRNLIYILFAMLIVAMPLDAKNKKVKNNDTTSIEKVTKPKKEKKDVDSFHCKATTKKGTRCSREATSNGYCWQHKDK